MKKLPEIDLSRFCMRKITFKVQHDASSAQLELTAVASIVNVDTGNDDVVYIKALIDLETAYQDNAYLAHYIRRQLLQMLEHELDECLYIDGKRLCENPHPELTRRVLVTDILDENQFLRSLSKAMR